MNRGHRKCEICGVQETRCAGKVFFAKFPSREHICKQWVKVVGKEDLVYLPIEKLHDLRYVCGRHFENRHFTKTKTRLKKTAVPTLQLTEPPLRDELLIGFPLHKAKKNQGLHPITEAAPEQPHQSGISTRVTTKSLHPITEAAPEQPHQSGISTRVTTKNPVSMEMDRQFYLDKPSTSTQSEDVIPTTAVIRVPVVNITKKRPLVNSCILNTNVPGISTNSAFAANDSKRIKLSEADLSPRETKLLQQLKKTKATLRSLRRTVNVIDTLNSTLLKDLITMAIKNQKRKPRGRRYTTKSKVSLLAIFKRSPKAYRYLRHLMPLPSEGTLISILKKIPMEPGLCGPALDHLKKHVMKNPQDKHCCLLFDEIALKPRLIHNNGTDKIEGFTDMGNGERTPAHANHALVFMLQGLKRKFKQPIAFYFVKGTVSSVKLAALIKEIIKSVNETGFNVMNTVCDQGPTNMGALKNLKDLSPSHRDDSGIKNYFTVGDKKIFIVYDVPHLLKSIRNNFMANGAMKMGGNIAKWEHILKVEERNRNLLYMSKISPIHVQPKYRAKMKVKYAAQVLSNTVRAVLMLLAPLEQDSAKTDEIYQTARVVGQLDHLFDYTNGPSGPADVKKGKRQNVSAKTDHIQVWTEYRKLLDTVIFMKPRTGLKATNVRCIEGFKTTLCSLRDIWTNWKRLGFKYLNLRQLNQDALENLFGVLRQHSPTNRHPTVASFIAGIKTAVVSNMTAPQSRGANCEKDLNSLLTDFHDIVFDNTVSTNTFQIRERQNENILMEEDYIPVLSIPDESDDNTPRTLDIQEFEEDIINLDVQPVVYVSGYIAHSILKMKKCSSCQECLTTNPDQITDLSYQYCKLREWWSDRSSLTYPSKGLYKCVEQCKNIFESEVVPIIYSVNIRQLTVTIFMAQSNNTFMTCNEHRSEVTYLIMVKLALLLIRRHCSIINKKIAIDEERIADAIKKSEQTSK